MVILYNYLEEGTIKIGVFCCRAPRRGLRIEIKSFQDNISKPICQAPRRGLRIEICGHNDVPVKSLSSSA